MTAPQRALQANSRGIAVLITAVVVGFLLLTQAGAGGGGSAPDDQAAPPPTTAEDDTTTTTDLDQDQNATDPDPDGGGEGEEPKPEGENGEGEEPDAAEAQVAVLNTTQIPGLAKTTMGDVTGAGYAPGFVGNAPPTDTTAIYYREGFQAQAEALASHLGKSTDIVKALSSPIPGTTDDDVVIVVIGEDFQA